MGWTTEGSEFECWWSQEFFLFHVVQTGSRVHLTSYSMGVLSPEVKQPGR
jgi:hypothetical protein